MAGIYDDFFGVLAPGDTGWLPLDENGTPNGPASLEPPPLDVPACAVQHTNMLDAAIDKLATIAGAPITDRMQPNPDRRLYPYPGRDSSMASDTRPLV